MHLTYIGCNSAYSLFQTLIYQAAFNPNILPWGSSPCDEDPDAPCHVTWAGGTKSYESVALIASALVFVGQSILFIFIGSTADYGSWAPWILRISVLIYGGLSLGFFGLKTPDAWPAAMALYTLTSKSLFDPCNNYYFFSFFHLQLLIACCRHRILRRVHFWLCVVS